MSVRFSQCGRAHLEAITISSQKVKRIQWVWEWGTYAKGLVSLEIAS